MSTVVFVHGTGVREPRHRALVGQITERLAAVRPDVKVTSCYWGGTHGATLRAHGASVPEYETTREVPFDSWEQPADDVDAWSLLYSDPIWELRLGTRAAARSAVHEAPPDQEQLGQDLARWARELVHDDAHLRELVDAAGLSGQLLPAVDTVLSDEDCQDALYLLAGDDSLPYLLVRAFVAEATRRLDEPGQTPPPLDGPSRDRVVDYATNVLSSAIGGTAPGEHRSAAESLLAAIGRLGVRLGARAVERRRGALTDAVFPMAGDVLVYLARGSALRSFIAEHVAAAEKPVTLMGHSLGGVASVDLVASQPEPGVRLLVTVGSQAPFLHELGALPSLLNGASLPDEFPPWLNVYDRRDLLAYIGERIFPGRIRDVAVDGRQPFPHAHSAYWSNYALYELLAGVSGLRG
jgi:hypothetical protein